jgi:hypothetical protein
MTGPDFRSHLARQLSFLERSCAAFDAGFHDEAIRIATVVRVLIHQTKNSTSLLKHLNATTINLLSTCEPTTPNTLLAKGMGTLSYSSEGGWSYFPSLGDGPIKELIPVSKWWDQEVMVHHPVRLTRRKIVLSAANQDGGAHIDEKLSAEYEALTKAGFAGVVSHTGPAGTTTKSLEGSHFVCLRQMGYELLHSPALLARVGG